MKHTDADKRDSIFVDRLHNLRQELTHRQKHHSIKQKLARFLLISPIVVVIAAGIFTYKWLSHSKTGTSPKPVQQIQQKVHKYAIAPASSQSPPSTDTHTDTLINAKRDTNMEANESSHTAPPPNTENEPMSQDITVSTGKTPSDFDKKENQLEPQTDNTTKPLPSANLDVKLCSSIKNRECDQPLTGFSIQKHSHMVVWMKILSQKLPQTIRHVYYLNGTKYCDIPLKIKYRRTRTWSRVRLNGASQIGTWTLKIINEKGDVLYQTEFEVTG